MTGDGPADMELLADVVSTFDIVSAPGAADCVVRAAGEIDILTGEVLRKVLLDGLAGSPGRLIVDMDEVSFIDSTGLAVLISAHKRAQHNGTELMLDRPSDRVRRVLELTGLDKVLIVVDW